MSKVLEAIDSLDRSPVTYDVPVTDTLPDAGPEWSTLQELRDRPTYQHGLPAISTGFTVLDNALGGGFRPECVYVLAGRTGAAKTSLATNLTRKMALDGNSVLLFKLEESPIEVTWRLHGAAAQVSLNSILDGTAWGDPRTVQKLDDAWKLLRDLPIRISANRDLDAIQRIGRHHVESGGKIIIIDQLGMVEIPGGCDIGYKQATLVSNALRTLAVNLHVAIICVVQINRGASKSSDVLTCNDLRDSGCIENDASAVLLIDRSRECGKATQWTATEPCRELDIIIGKNRYGPTTGKDDPLHLLWWPRLGRIEDVAHDTEHQR